MSDEARINKPKVTAAATTPTQSGSMIVSHFGATCGNGVFFSLTLTDAAAPFLTRHVCLFGRNTV